MSVLVVNPLATVSQAQRAQRHLKFKARERLIPLLFLAAAMFLLHGYHPYSQDAAIYISGIERVVDPSLFRVDAAFVDCHTKLSVFSHLMAAAVLVLHGHLAAILLGGYFATGFLFLYACQQLALRVFVSETARWSATILAAVCSTMPAAATSLLLTDPYLTARSFSTPFSLLAVVCCLDRAWKGMALWAGLTLLFHPLMGIYLCFFLLILVLEDRRSFAAVGAICGLAFLVSGLISFLSRNIPISDSYRVAALSRSYYFLSRWEWYEIIGIVAPILLLAAAAAKSRLSTPAGKLSGAGAIVGFTVSLISLSFVRTSHPDLLMRVQVLRSFHLVYAVGLVLLGGFIASVLRQWKTLVALLLIPMAAMAFADRQSNPAAAHIEWPWQHRQTPQLEAYEWITANTPADAVFAADTASNQWQYDSESAGFRAVTRRSTLHDSKDEGLASLFPPLATVWGQWNDAQFGLNQQSDTERRERLRPLGVTWLLLSPQARTSFPCPYRNSVLAVCQMEP